jgi:hypothetical protein
VVIDSAEPLCSMSAFTGLLAIRSFRASHPDISLTEAVQALKKLSDSAYHDYDKAVALDEWLSAEADHANPATFFRQILSALIAETQPWWLRVAVTGRKRLEALLKPNELQCFESSGLLTELPGSDVVEWWDNLARHVRSEIEAKKLLQGRTGEQLTLAYEKARLQSLGISEMPRWTALDDCTAGYDIHSFDSGSVGPISKLIETKSTIRRPPEIFLTRNEWEIAVERAPNYYFHVWLLPEESLIELKPEDLTADIPLNQGSGLWEVTRVILRHR